MEGRQASPLTRLSALGAVTVSVVSGDWSLRPPVRSTSAARPTIAPHGVRGTPRKRTSLTATRWSLGSRVSSSQVSSISAPCDLALGRSRGPLALHRGVPVPRQAEVNEHDAQVRGRLIEVLPTLLHAEVRLMHQILSGLSRARREVRDPAEAVAVGTVEVGHPGVGLGSLDLGHEAMIGDATEMFPVPSSVGPRVALWAPGSSQATMPWAGGCVRAASVIVERMGRDSDSRPPIEMLGEAGPHQGPQRIQVGTGGGRRRTYLLLATVVGAVLIAGLLVGDSDGGEGVAGRDADRKDRAADPDVAATAPSSVMASGPTTTLVGESGPVFGKQVGASLLLGSESGGWRAFDLDTGILQEVPELMGSAPEAMVPVQGGVVMLKDFTSPLKFVPVPEGASRSLHAALPDPPRLAGVVGVIPTGRPDRLWLTWALMDPEADEQLAVITDLQGRPVADEIVVRGTPMAGTMAGLVFNAGGKTYLNGRDGVGFLSDGVAYAASATEVAVLSCDDAAGCWPTIIDTASGQGRRGPSLPGVTHGSPWMSLSPDGRLLVIPAREAPMVTSPLGFVRLARTVFMVDVAGSAVSGDVEDLRSNPAWLPGDLGAVAMTGYGVVRLYDDAGSMAIERVPGLRAGFDDTVFVIPHQ